MTSAFFERPMNMNKTLIALTLVSLYGAASADEIGRVISSVPMVQAIAVPRQVCKIETVAAQTPKSGAGAVLGAIAGGVVGHALGDGGARAAATMIGMVGGTVLGDRMEEAGDVQAQSIQRCETQHMVENQIKGYRVTYEYAGQQYTVEWPTDPGPSIALQVLPKASRQAVPGAPYLGVQPPNLPVNTPVYTSASAPVFVPTVSATPVQILWGFRGWPSPRHFH
jgi:uncharacterized protein YcfJ